MKIYVIEDPDKLIGKTVSYIELNRFSIPAIMVTTDGGIMIWETSAEEDTMSEEIEIDVYSKNRVEAHVFNNERMIERIMKCRFLVKADFDSFLSQQREERKQEQEQSQIRKEEYDRKEFERLKNKFALKAEV